MPRTLRNNLITSQKDCDQPINMDEVRVDPNWALRIPVSLARQRGVLPVCTLRNQIVVACRSLQDANQLRPLRKCLGEDLWLVEAEPRSLERAIARVFSGGESPSINPSADAVLSDRAKSDEVVQLVDRILRAALLNGASDIHFRPQETGIEVEFRVDGMLERFESIPVRLQSGVVNRLKVLSGMDLAEKRSPQDGRAVLNPGNGAERELRVSTLPTKFGERVTLRVHAKQGSFPDLVALGIEGASLDCLEKCLAAPNGLILLTGPTGSGKSTTLYAAIEHLLRLQKRNVITVEDPIEYRMQGVSQVEVDSADKVSFGKALRSILRHDPDVVMIGEIRDHDTAEIAIKASLTGHLVLSTLHTNNAVGVITRLIDMGIDPYLVSATLRMSAAQRLVRQLCRKCHKRRTMTTAEAIALGRPDAAGSIVFDPVGCIYCAGRGYRGRTAIFELVESDRELAIAISSRKGEEELIQSLAARRQRWLMDDGLAKLEQGSTSVSELLAAVSGA